MSSVTETRLAAYVAAEAAILQAQEVRGGDTSHRLADLESVRDQIDKLQRQLARESRGSAVGFSVANLSGE